MHTKHTIEVNDEKIAYFEYPTKQALKGIVLFCHGFPGGNRLDTLAKPLNEHEITLIEANYRGDPECGGKFSFFGSLDDIKTLTHAIKKQYPVVPITILGFSMGGFFTCCLARDYPDLFNKIVLLNPLLDVSFTKTEIMQRLWIEAHEALQLYDQNLYRDETERMFHEANPIDFVPELKPKIHMVISTNDEVLPPATAQRFYDRLPNKGKFTWIQGAEHSVSGDEPEIINALTT
ncbi:MAG: alpha/beta fold hydrolase [Patescibacteria group bacterium]